MCKVSREFIAHVEDDFLDIRRQAIPSVQVDRSKSRIVYTDPFDEEQMFADLLETDRFHMQESCGYCVCGSSLESLVGLRHRNENRGGP